MLLRKHYSSAELLAYFDGEAPRRARAQIESHLPRCWSCRSKLLRLEQQIQIATEMYGAPEVPGSPSDADQKRRFLDTIAQFEWQFSERTAEAAWSTGWLPIAVAVVILAVIAVWNIPRRPSPPAAMSPVEVLARSAAAEQLPPRRAVHQAFAVNLHQSRPVVEDREARLQIWSDPVANRFSSRLEDKEGRLRLGIWRDSGRAYVYRADKTTSRHRPALAIADMASRLERREGFESAFLDWLESRDWQPILLGSETAILRTAQGEWVRARRSDGPDTGIVTLVISKELGAVKMTVSVEFDTRTYRVRMQRLQMTTARWSAEIRLTVLQREFMEPARMRDAVFRPDHGLLPRDAAPVIAPVLPPVQTRTSLETSSSSLDDRETEVLYTLHRLHADLGDPVTVRQHAGRIRVEALLNSAERKHEISEALLASSAGSVLDLDIKTVDELTAAAGAGGDDTPPLLGQGLDEMSQSVADQSQTKLRLDVQKLLRGQESGDGFVDTGNAAVRLSSKTLEDAWALRRLGERYTEDRLMLLQPHSRSLVAAMARDLTEMLQNDAAELRRVLQSSLRAFAGSASLAVISATDSQAGISDMFQAVLKTRDMVHFAFAGRRLDGNDEQRFLTAPAFARELFVRCDGLNEHIRLAGREMLQRFATDTR